MQNLDNYSYDVKITAKTGFIDVSTDMTCKEDLKNQITYCSSSTYGVETSNIVVGKEVSYIPPTNTVFYKPTFTQNNHWKYLQEVSDDKVTSQEFYSREDLILKYGASYKDYLNDVEHTNASFYNTLYKDNSISADFNYDSESIIKSYNF